MVRIMNEKMIIGLTLLAAPSGYAKDTNSIFAGSVADSKGVDTLASYEGTSGLDVYYEMSNDNTVSQKPNLYRAGLRTPFVGPVRLIGAMDVPVIDAKVDSVSWTGLGEVKLEDFALRAGMVPNALQGKMGLGGLRYDGDHFFFDADALSSGSNFEGNGSVGTLIGDHMYLSVGGNSFDHMITSSQGWLNTDGFGFLHLASIIPKDDTVKGKLFVGDEFAYKTGNGRARDRIRSNTMHSRVLNGWAPLDGDSTSNLGFVGSYAVSPVAVNATGTLYKNFAQNHLVGMGIEYAHSRVEGNGTTALTLEEAILIPGTPLGQWSLIKRDFESGALDATVYVGGSGDF